jgi:hypothetical protein
MAREKRKQRHSIQF